LRYAGSVAADLADKPIPVQPMSYEEFLAWSDEDVRAEWVDGKVVPMSPASNRHQDLARFLTVLLSHYAEARDLGVVRPAPFQMKTGPDLPGREPDILFVANEHLERLEKNHLAGPADLVVAIISPESRARGRGEKFYEYEQGGVLEYWLLDPEREQAEFYQWAGGIYRFISASESYESRVLSGLKLYVPWLWQDWLWQEPLPPLLSVLKVWKLV
jgi:Uma2 family endonuclease